MFYFKACPKCRGDLYLEKDIYGAYVKCLQCGRLVDLAIRQPEVTEEVSQPAVKLAA